VESDVAQISANERFALLVPEKRPFFLEGSELFQTPIPRSTRAPSPHPVGRAHYRKGAGIRYTALAVHDDGGGSVILPAPTARRSRRKSSVNGLRGARKRDIGRSFIGLLLTDREAAARILQPRARARFQWRPMPAMQSRAVADQRYAHAQSPDWHWSGPASR